MKPLPADASPWREEEVDLGVGVVRLATRPDALPSASDDTSRRLLAAHVAGLDAPFVLDLECGSGLVGAAAALRGASVLMTERSVIAHEAAKRTVRGNDLGHVDVRLQHGTGGLTDLAPADAVAVRLPKGKLPTLQLLWDAFHALGPGKPCLVAGANAEGIKSAARRVEQLFGNAEVVSYGGRSRMISARRETEAPVDASEFQDPWLDHDVFHEMTAEVGGHSFEIRARPGVFSWDQVDEGSRLLVETIKIRSDDRVLDLGCGCGVLSVAAAVRATDGEVHGVDVDIEAVRSARATIAANGLSNCTIWPGDGGSAMGDFGFDTVITNPPVHLGQRANFETAFRFFRDAASLLRPRGKLYLVANRTLPYERAVQETFGNVEIVTERGGFKVLRAVRSRRRN